MEYFLIPIPNWVFPVLLTLMTVSVVASIIDIVLKVQIKKNQNALDTAIESQNIAIKAAIKDMRG